MQESWLHYFQSNVWPGMPWEDLHRLSDEETVAITSSVQQFELGEGSDGRAFIERARTFAEASGDADFIKTLELFIKEEQRHSASLGRFMDIHGIPHLKKHWLDRIFRRIRRLSGLELIVTVLVTAEIIAVPYYRALHNATASPLLRALCCQILRDEATHLRYQAGTLASLRRGRSPVNRALAELFHAILLHGTVLVVWMEHRGVFVRGGYNRARLLRESEQELGGVQRETYANQSAAQDQAGGMPHGIESTWTFN